MCYKAHWCHQVGAASVLSASMKTLKHSSSVICPDVRRLKEHLLQAAQWRARSISKDENERCERVSARLRELPLHKYHTRDTLERMSMLELQVCCLIAPDALLPYCSKRAHVGWGGYVRSVS